MLVPFKDTGKYGIIKDIEPHELPKEAWSGGNNVVCKDGAIERINGNTVTTYGTPTVEPIGITYSQKNGSNWWLYGDLDNLYSLNGTTHTDVTRVSGVYTMADTDKWHFTSLGAGVVIANNQVDDPQFWTVAATACVDLTNWPAATTCKAIRALRSHLIAMDVTESGTRYENKLRWSTPADPGSVPASWAENDATVTSGSTNIGSDSPLVDLLPLGETGIIYKSDDCWSMNYVGGQFIWDFNQNFSELGMLALGCGVQLGNSHIVLTGNDLVQHNGIEATSIIDKRMKRFLFNDIDTGLYKRTFALKSEFKKEIYFYYVQSGGTSITNVLIWDYQNNTFTIKDIPEINSAATGIIDGTNLDTYATNTDTYNSTTDTYHGKQYSPTAERILMGTVNTTILLDDQGTDFNGTAITSFAEKTGISFDAPEQIKLVKSVRPRFDAAPGTEITIYVGQQATLDAAIAWTSQTFTVGTDYKSDFLVAGRYISIRFESVGGNGWRLNSFDMDVDVQGFF